MPFQLGFNKKHKEKKRENKNQGEIKNPGHVWKKFSTR